MEISSINTFYNEPDKPAEMDIIASASKPRRKRPAGELDSDDDDYDNKSTKKWRMKKRSRRVHHRPLYNDKIAPQLATRDPCLITWMGTDFQASTSTSTIVSRRVGLKREEWLRLVGYIV